MTTDAGRHPVYAGGPPCADGCPGEWSTYHDGYSWGYEKARRDALDEAIKVVGDLWHERKWQQIEDVAAKVDLLDRLEALRDG